MNSSSIKLFFKTLWKIYVVFCFIFTLSVYAVTKLIELGFHYINKFLSNALKEDW